MTSFARAMPKSQTLTSPSNETSRFDGDTSRCTMPSGLPVVVGAAVRVVEPLSASRTTWSASSKGSGTFALRAAPEQIVEVEALDVLHRDEEALVLAPEVEDLHHVRVAQARRELRLVDQHLAEGRVARELRQDLLHDAEPRGAELGLLARQVDLGHPAFADEVEQGVAAERARQEDAGAADMKRSGTSPSLSVGARSSQCAGFPARGKGRGPARLWRGKGGVYCPDDVVVAAERPPERRAAGGSTRERAAGFASGPPRAPGRPRAARPSDRRRGGAARRGDAAGPRKTSSRRAAASSRAPRRPPRRCSRRWGR